MPIAGQFSRLTRQLRAALAGLFDQDQPFGRLALVHTVFSAATTLVTISLAGTLFFTVSVHESDKRVLLYLLLSLAPFAIVAPLLSPLLDRGATARRASIGVACGGSAIVTLFMARDISSLLLFPEAFSILVLSKLYLVGKASLVPSMTESTDDLASANAKLTMLASLAGFAVSPIGIGILQLGATWVLRFTFGVFVVGAIAAVRLPRSTSLPAPPKPLGAHPDGRPLHGPNQPAPLPLADASSGKAAGPGGRPGGLLYQGRSGRASRPPRIDVKQERRRLGLSMIGPEVTIALGAMTVLRASFGFLTFFLAFALKNLHSATWWYGVILLASGIGGLIGSMSVPTIRRYLSEQQLLSVALVATALVAVITAIMGTLSAQPILAFAVGLSSTAAKPAFDSIAQTYVPPAALGRAFGRFETQLQLAWVLAALIAVKVAFRFAPGDVLIAAACAIAAAFHWSMRHSLGNRRAADSR
ncbi:MAG: MFS transporter [Acidimicrobiales bacterium]